MTVFETERLIIKQICPEDIKDLLQIYNKVENMRFISKGKHQWTRAELTEKLSQSNKDYHSGIGIFALILKSEQTLIGEAGLFNSFGNLKKLELGYIIDSKYWNKGLGKEVCNGLIHYAFDKLQAEELIARMYAENTASVKLSEKCGMIKTDSGTTTDERAFLVYSKKTSKKYKS